MTDETSPRAARDGTGAERLFTTRWIHVFEEDTPEGAVYAPEDGPVPLSRRPRERLEICADGSARLFAPGPDDRPVEHAATWTADGADLCVRVHRSGAELRVVRRSPDRLLVQRLP